MRDFEKHPLVKQAIDMFEAEITRLEEPRAEQTSPEQHRPE